MYRIINTATGETVGMTEALNYVKTQRNGCYALCPEADAEGIVFAGTVYALLGRAGLAGKIRVATVPVDGGAELSDAEAALEDADAINVDHEYRLTLLELGVTEEV